MTSAFDSSATAGPAPGGKPISSQARARALRDHLFANLDLTVYAVLDGASIRDLLGKLQEQAPNHACLFAGKLHPSELQTAPYVVELEPKAKFTQWVLEEGFGKHWGIFATTEAPLKTFRKHLKTFLRVTGTKGKPGEPDRPLRIFFAHPRKRRERIIELTEPFIVLAGAALGSPEVKSQGGEPGTDERARQGMRDFVMHCAAVLRMRMTDDGGALRRRISR